MKTTVTELPESRARVEAEVPEAEVGRATQRAARALAREMRLPGFRKGKAPPSLVIRRLGFEAVLEQAIRDSLPGWYERAVLSSGVTPIGDPELEIVSAPQGEGEPLGFKFEVGVRPKAKLGEYRGLELPRPDPEVPEEIVEREIGRIREGFARLEPVDRPAALGDVAMIDFEGTVDGKAFSGGVGTDYVLELGSGQLIEDFERQLVGAAAGEEREVRVTFADDHQAEHLAGKEAVFAVTVKEVREKVLPALDDDFAAEASEFDTIAELREDIRARLSEAVERRVEQDFRIAAIDAAVAKATVDIPDDLIAARAAERWERVERQLAGRGIQAETYLRLQGTTRDELIEQAKPDAEREMRREAVLAAIADAEGIDVSEEELVEALEHTAEHERTTPEKLLARLRADGRDAMVREDIRIRKAIDLIAESAKPIPMEREEARERLWTPEKEGEAKKGALWTPGSE